MQEKLKELLNHPLSDSFDENIRLLYTIFPIGTSFDILTRELRLRNTRAFWIGINGFCDNDQIQDLIYNLQNPKFNENPVITDLKELLCSKIAYSQAELTSSWQDIVKGVLSGSSALFVDGFSEAVMIDSRLYPDRSVEEPDTEKITRGAKDGFIENILSNIILIRRRIRIPSLTFEIKSIGNDSQTDVSITYVKELADPDLLCKTKERLKELGDAAVTALTMGSRSLEELLVPRRFRNPLPSLFTTERPDVACSYLLEGYVLLMVDNSPSVIVLPGNIFQFTQSPEDYYKSPAVGTLNRLMRLFCILLSIFSLPVFLLLGSCHETLPGWLSNINADSINPFKLFILILFTEFGFHLFRYASSHSFHGFSGALSIVGGLILSEVAIDLKWTSLETIFYASLTMLASLAISSIEFSDALRFYRLLLIFCTGTGLSIGYFQGAPDHLFWYGFSGLILGFLLMVFSMVTTPVFAEKSYFWPLVPWNWNALKTLLFRKPTTKAQPSRVWKR